MFETDVQPKQMNYGCVFCRTTREKSVAKALEEWFPGLRATAVSRIKNRSEQGRKYTEEQILLPGYVFFRTETEFLNEPIRVQDVIRLLKNPQESWRLIGSDARFAEFVFQHDGILELSKVRNLGDTVKVIEGPLKEMEGQIVKIDRHRRSGLVEFQFDDHLWKTWLAFEFVE